MRRAATILGATLVAMVLGTGVASAEDWVIYKKGSVTRPCTLAERWSVGAIPGVDTCVVESPLNR